MFQAILMIVLSNESPWIEYEIKWNRTQLVLRFFLLKSFKTKQKIMKITHKKMVNCTYLLVGT